jgi:hypothetical protein
MLFLRKRLLAPLLVLSATALAGCGPDPYAGRMEITGTVKLKGQSLKDGSIRFVPLENQGTENGAPIVNGEYDLPRKSGLKPGKYLVQITAGDGKTPAFEEAGGPDRSTNIVSWDLIPEEWNVKSKQQVEVKSSGTNKFDFDIPNINTKKKR